MIASKYKRIMKLKEGPVDINQLSRCRFCRQLPNWNFHKSRISKYWDGYLEHFCSLQEYYLHGASRDVLKDWNKKNEMTKPSTIQRFQISEKRGELPYMVTWQSNDGRVITRYFQTFSEASAQSKHLTRLGRTAKLWVNVNPSKDKA